MDQLRSSPRKLELVERASVAMLPTIDQRPARREMLTVREAAEFLKLCERTVTYLANRRELPGCKLGGKWRFYRDDLENLPLK